jgi:hypothetical protein
MNGILGEIDSPMGQNWRLGIRGEESDVLIDSDSLHWHWSPRGVTYKRTCYGNKGIGVVGSQEVTAFKGIQVRNRQRGNHGQADTGRNW